MHRVVDAMNVIGSRPDGWWHDRIGAIEHLVARLDRWAEVRDERVTVMLEQPPQRLPVVERVAVEWAPRAGADSADHEIVRRLPDWLAEAGAERDGGAEGERDGETEGGRDGGAAAEVADVGRVVVVTSDRDLAARVREAGAEVEPSSPFREALDAL